MVEAYEEKYSSRNPAIVIKAFDYHHDINFKESIEMIGSDYTWENIEARLGQMTLHPGKLFSENPR
jgi:hypothetical protein